MSKRKFCAHRGFNAVAPENTLPAFAAAVALGADEIEFDLWPTADGQLAVCHDPSVDRTTDGKGTICDMTWEQMKNLDAGKKFHSEYEGVRIPLFEEVLRQFAGKVVMNIHIKSIGASVLKNRIMEGRGQELMEIYTENKPLPMPLREPEPMVLKDLEDREIPAYRMKLVMIFCSVSGASIPAFLPASIHFNSHAMLLPNVRMIWRPSASFLTSSGVLP